MALCAAGHSINRQSRPKHGNATLASPSPMAPRPNRHRALCTAAAPPHAISSTGAFRTPAVSARGWRRRAGIRKATQKQSLRQGNALQLFLGYTLAKTLDARPRLPCRQSRLQRHLWVIIFAISCAGLGKLYKEPCTSDHPAARTMSRCATVSTPSAVVDMPRLGHFRHSRTIATASVLPSDRPLMKERSILILSNGKLRK